MTPTREQLASIEWAGADSSCPVCRVYGPGHFHANIDVFPHAPDCWLAACLAAPPPEPQAMPPIEQGDWVRYMDNVWEVKSPDAWTDIMRDEFVTEIRKANGTVWTEPRR